MRSGAVLTAYLAGQVEQLRDAQDLARQGDPEAAHRMRLAARRIRAALRTFRRLLDPGRIEPVQAQLALLIGALAEARDVDAARDHLRAAIAADPGDLVLGPVAARVLTALGTRYRSAQEVVAAELDGPHHQELLTALDRLLADPPLRRRGRRPAVDVLPAEVARAWRQVRSRHRRAVVQPDTARRDPQLHRLRCAVRRTRYAAEVCVPVSGDPARSFARRLHAVQGALGEHQDTLVFRDRLRELGVSAHLDGENGFSYGRLHALEQWRAERSLEDFYRVWARADRRRLRLWMRGPSGERAATDAEDGAVIVVERLMPEATL